MPFMSHQNMGSRCGWLIWKKRRLSSLILFNQIESERDPAICYIHTTHAYLLKADWLWLKAIVVCELCWCGGRGLFVAMTTPIFVFLIWLCVSCVFFRKFEWVHSCCCCWPGFGSNLFTTSCDVGAEWVRCVKSEIQSSQEWNLFFLSPFFTQHYTTTFSHYWTFLSDAKVQK